MKSRKDGSSTVINVLASGNARPVTASNSVITITENNVVNEEAKAKEEQKQEVPTEQNVNKVETQLAFMHAMKKPYVHIIHNYRFSQRDEPIRHGSEIDLQSLKDLFETQWSFQTRVDENMTADGILKKARDIGERDYSENDSFFFIILSHGNQNGILGVDENHVSLAALTDFFTSDKCKSLRGKPKVFIVQACRGDKEDPGAVVSDATPGRAVNTALQAVPVESDFLVCYASPIGYSSYRDTENGSWYIQELVRIFKKYHTEEHLMDLMLRVNFAVSKKSCDLGKQIPSEECRLTKKCYFHSLPQSTK